MRHYRRGSIALAVLATALLGANVAGAAAAPAWSVSTVWGPANLAPGQTGMFKVQVRNTGDSNSTGTVTVTTQLPPGVTRIAPSILDQSHRRNELSNSDWSCAGSSLVTCTTSLSVMARSVHELPPFTPHGFAGYASRIIFRVGVAPGATEGEFTTTSTVSGGGAAEPGSQERSVTVSSTPTPFGVPGDGFGIDSYDDEFPAGAPVRQAGAHPFEMRIDLLPNLVKLENPSESPGLLSPLTWLEPAEYLKTIETKLPVGFLGNPEATPKCTAAQFLSLGAQTYGSAGCPPASQIGVADLVILDGEERGGETFTPGGAARIAVYNLEPPPGVPADFGMSVGPIQAHIYPMLDPADDYAIKAVVPQITTIAPIREARMTLWGVPGDPAHNHLRSFSTPRTEPAFGAASNAPIRPLLTQPMDCGASGLRFEGRFESWQHPGRFTPSVGTEPFAVAGCDDPRFRFRPAIAMRPSTTDAGAPTGLDVNLVIPQRNDEVDQAEDLYHQNGHVAAIPTPPLKRVEIEFPEGMTLSPSAAQGLGSCAPHQIKMGTNEPVTCPDNSQYGTLTLKTPILPADAPMSGRIYIAKQNENPFNEFLALYLVVEDPERGLMVKLPGRIQLGSATGRISASFDDLPQFPVSDMQMTLKSGVRAGLVNPSTCGTKTITATFYSWHDPGTPIVKSSSYDVTRRPDGSPCVNTLGERPFAPLLEAGTLSGSAGTYSPFVMRLQRSDDDQEFSRLGVTMPKGLTAKIKGIAECSEAAIAAAGHPDRSAAEELASPSCPADSYLGRVEVGAGVGVPLTYLAGRAYLAGPYRGAPYSLAIVTPLQVGPYDLGVIAVRAAITLDPETTEIEITSDPFPQIFKGIPVRLRDIRVLIDRPQATLNPTNCDPKSIGATIGGAGGDPFSPHDDTSVTLANRFQAANCDSLGFKPKLSFKLEGGTKRGQFPAISAKLTTRPGDANFAGAQVTLPRSAFLEQGHIRTICTRVQFRAKACPPGSVIGHAKATTPLLDGFIEGPVVMRSSNNKLPDLVASLDGRVAVNVAARIDSFKKRVRATFDVLPDVPVSSFELQMQGGKKGLIVNSRDLCKTKNRAEVRLTGQNGKRAESRPLVKPSSCRKARKGKRKARAQR